MTTIAFLGTGTTGLPMARNLARAGFELRAWNRSAERARPLADHGAEVFEDSREAAAGVTLIDAPVLGTREPAERAKLVVLASGPLAVRKRAQPVFDAFDRDDELAIREAERAAAEAAAIGGRVSSDPEPTAGKSREAERPLAEAGEGEAEGFELAEEALVEHASHGDQHAARRASQDASQEGDDALAARASEADREYSSEREDDG